MHVLQKYFRNEISRAVLFVLISLLVLTSFFDLMGEVRAVGADAYEIRHALLVVALGIPGNIYDFMPIAVLIGTIYVLAQFAANSEFTIMRAASMSPWQAAKLLFRVAFIFVILTFVVGEWLAPWSADLAKKVKLNSSRGLVAQNFRTGLWTKDVIRDNGASGAIIGSRFINVKEVTPDQVFLDLKIEEFNSEFELIREITAKKAAYIRPHVWLLSDVVETSFPKNLESEEIAASHTSLSVSKELISDITPDILLILFVEPERMSAYDLAAYTQHLTENKQASATYQMAFWKKISYPFSILVMMALALPFAFLHARNGGISLRIFYGIMLGMLFYLVNSLFSHLGLIHTWPALITALFPSLLFSIIALGMLRYVQGR